MMAESEPWITLGRDVSQILPHFEDPTKEAYAAEVAGKLVGVVVVNMQGPLPGYIQVLVVVPGHRSRGIGAQLLQFAEKRILRDSPNVFLCVSGFNHRAQQFYLRHGYKKIGDVKDFVISGASEWLMRKTTGPWQDFKRTAG
jgi:ribosomal protein S18 acetylase RimI-like enzyme